MGCSEVVGGEVDEVVGRIDVVEEDVDEVVRLDEVVLDGGGVGVGKGVSIGVGKGVGVGNGVGAGVGVCAPTRLNMCDGPRVPRTIPMHTTKNTTDFLIIGLTRSLSLLISSIEQF